MWQGYSELRDGNGRQDGDREHRDDWQCSSQEGYGFVEAIRGHQQVQIPPAEPDKPIPYCGGM